MIGRPPSLASLPNVIDAVAKQLDRNLEAVLEAAAA